MPVSKDPFFDKPYEEPAVTDAPSWDSAEPRPVRSISANIKSRRRVAALFKPEVPAPEPEQQS